MLAAAVVEAGAPILHTHRSLLHSFTMLNTHTTHTPTQEAESDPHEKLAARREKEKERLAPSLDVSRASSSGSSDTVAANSAC